MCSIVPWREGDEVGVDEKREDERRDYECPRNVLATMLVKLENLVPGDRWPGLDNLHFLSSSKQPTRSEWKLKHRRPKLEKSGDVEDDGKGNLYTPLRRLSTGLCRGQLCGEKRSIVVPPRVAETAL